MIEALAKQMKFQVMPVDEDHPELGSKLVGVVELRSEYSLDDGKASAEEIEYLKTRVTGYIHEFLYAELKEKLDKLYVHLLDIQRYPQDCIGNYSRIRSALATVIVIQRKIKGT